MLNKNINYNKPTLFYNPINYKSLDEYKPIFEKFSTKEYNKNIVGDINLSLDILTQGNIINLSLPSVGLIKPVLSNGIHSIQNFTDFIKAIVHTKDFKDISYSIPLRSLNIGDTIADILSDTENISNIMNVNNILNNLDNINNNKTKLIKKMIDTIEINMEDIFNDKSINKKSPIKSEFIIPYRKDLKEPEKIILMTKSEIATICNKGKIEDMHKHNKDLSTYVILLTLNDESIMNRPNYKNVLACFLFYIIRIVYDICKKYINSIDNILKYIIDSKDKRFKLLNIKGAFEYTTALDKSLLKFKSVLLNNFYQLFLPSKITEFYGMHQDVNRCFIPEYKSVFTRDNEYIRHNYPFWEIDTINPLIPVIAITDNDKISNFILNISEKHDINNPDNILELGGRIFSNDTMKYVYKILTEYYTFLQKNNKFILFIIDKIIQYFNKKNIPIELLEDLVNDMYMVLAPYNKDKISNKLLLNFELYLEKSTNYYKKVIDIRNKIKSSKRININNLHNLEEVSLLNFNIYLTRALCYVPVTAHYITDIKLKNTLLTEYLKIKKKYENIIISYSE